MRHLYVIIVVVFGWVLFRSDSFVHAFYYVKSMFGAYEGSLQMNNLKLVWYGHDVTIALIFAVIFSYPVLPTIQKVVSDNYAAIPKGVFTAIDLIKYAYLLILLLICMMPLFGATYNAFIYFRF
jgi:alginate O-acetyltransferase complex protein AlgI